MITPRNFFILLALGLGACAPLVLAEDRPLQYIGYHHDGSGAYGPGPGGDPREWTLVRWTGKEWTFSVIAPVDHNYDYGNLHVEADGTLVVVGPTGAGPQPYWTGGEMAMWVSKDHGATWRREHELTRDSTHNHAYARIPVNPHPDFFALWADGHAEKRSESRLYFSTRDGRVFRLPGKMESETAKPELVTPRSNPRPKESS